ncbi:MAG: DUF3782 domain-containing protein [Thermofilaceae archaeon]|nr:DUF3782 domain-containing protein [Thermofilaceae archaeon]
MPTVKSTLKSRILELLKKDEEFRLAVAGLIGLDEILKDIRNIQQELAKLREDLLNGFRRHDETLARHAEEISRLWIEIAKLRAEMIEGFKRHDEILLKHGEEIAKLRAEMIEGFKRHDEILLKHGEEIAKLRAEMIEGFKRHDEILLKHGEEIAKLRAEMIEGFKRHDEILLKHGEEIAKLKADFYKGFSSLNRKLDALGSRWGIMSENAFREGLRKLLKDLDLKVERWRVYDIEGRVYGYASEVELDIAIKDGKLIIVEITSHAKASDISEFYRKAALYAEKTGRKPDRLLVITPYADEKALRAAEQLGIEVYTNV